MLLAYKINGTVAVFLCVALFTAGIVVDSIPYRAQINAERFDFAAPIAIILTCAPSNVSLLALLLVLIAGCACIITQHRPRSIPINRRGKKAAISWM